MTTETLAPTAPLDELAGLLTGELHLPGSDGYTRTGTPWNLAIPSRPIAVAAVADVEDVVTAVRWAREHGVPVAVRATGHGAVDELDGSLLIHTGRLDELAISPEGRARVGAGVRWRRVLDEASELGFAAPAGSAPNVGVVGFLTGGGLGPLSRTIGLSSDRVRAFDVVTGDGVLRRASAGQEQDLFWALKGGKGALGVVTAVELDLVALPSLLGGALYFAAADGDRVVRAWAAWCPTLPPEATTSVAILRMPDMPGLPAPLAGRTTVAVRFAWTGDPVDGDAVLEPIRRIAPVVFGGVGVMPPSALGMIHSDPEDPLPSHESAVMLTGLPPEAVDALLAAAGPTVDVPQVVVELRQLGGAVAQGSSEHGSFCGRDIAFTFVTIGVAAGPGTAAMTASAAAIAAALAPWDSGRRLPNFTPTIDPEQVLRVYDRDVLVRLAELVARLDPDGIIASAEPVRRARALLGG